LVHKFHENQINVSVISLWNHLNIPYNNLSESTNGCCWRGALFLGSLAPTLFEWRPQFGTAPASFLHEQLLPLVDLANAHMVDILWMGQQNPNHQLIDGKHPIMNIGFQPSVSGGAGYLPSTVVPRYTWRLPASSGPRHQHDRLHGWPSPMHMADLQESRSYFTACYCSTSPNWTCRNSIIRCLTLFYLEFRHY
jgi:hypothetical protein